jgi:hypothetical protein
VGTVACGRADEDNPVKWTTPASGWVKVNWDASCAKNKGWIGLGVVVRDENVRKSNSSKGLHNGG